jgi:hypothetical protein
MILWLVRRAIDGAVPHGKVRFLQDVLFRSAVFWVHSILELPVLV